MKKKRILYWRPFSPGLLYREMKKEAIRPKLLKTLGTLRKNWRSLWLIMTIEIQKWNTKYFKKNDKNDTEKCSSILLLKFLKYFPYSPDLQSEIIFPKISPVEFLSPIWGKKSLNLATLMDWIIIYYGDSDVLQQMLDLYIICTHNAARFISLCPAAIYTCYSQCHQFMSFLIT